MRLRRLLLASVTGSLVAASLVGFGSGQVATAAPVVACTQTFTGTGKALVAEDPAVAPAYRWTVAPITVPASSNVEDINVTFDISHPRASNLSIRLTRMEGTTVTNSIALHSRFTTKAGAQPRPLTFDDEAAGPYGTTSPSGTYKPATALSSFDGTAAGAIWRLDMANYQAITTAKLNSWSVTITFSVCDGDGDGAEDHSDNCRGLANATQADADGDGIGDACDGDLDGDGAANPADNCVAVANPDQADTDRNGVGDACTGDDDGDGLADTVDGCALVAGATASGCPSFARSVAIKVGRAGKKGKKKAVRKRIDGAVSSNLSACRGQAEVTIWRQRKGSDRKLVLLRTGADGRFRVRAPREPGRYYATVAPNYLANLAECAAGRSKAARIRR